MIMVSVLVKTGKDNFLEENRSQRKFFIFVTFSFFLYTKMPGRIMIEIKPNVNSKLLNKTGSGIKFSIWVRNVKEFQREWNSIE